MSSLVFSTELILPYARWHWDTPSPLRTEIHRNLPADVIRHVASGWKSDGLLWDDCTENVENSTIFNALDLCWSIAAIALLFVPLFNGRKNQTFTRAPSHCSCNSSFRLISPEFLPLSLSLYIYICVCVCVCVYTYTHNTMSSVFY
jgi:hypothetical protein